MRRRRGEFARPTDATVATAVIQPEVYAGLSERGRELVAESSPRPGPFRIPWQEWQGSAFARVRSGSFDWTEARQTDGLSERRRTGANAAHTCHAEGRGFESLHPLRKPPPDGGFSSSRSRLGAKSEPARGGGSRRPVLRSLPGPAAERGAALDEQAGERGG
jgi:hypothetical protein